MSNTEDIRTLMQNTIGITVKYEPLHREHRFNIFSILRHGHEEVSLHSRFLAELLDPKGKHGHDDEFLEQFLRRIDNEKHSPIEPQEGSSSVEFERPFHTDNADGRIDILIQTSSRIVIIENKIYASDQSHQLDRYYDFAKYETKQQKLHRNPIICYLTLWGEYPDDSTWSWGRDHPELRVLSYKDIRDWLDGCLGRAALEPALRETIHQYQLLIDKLRGETMAEDEKREVVSAIMRNRETVAAARDIHQAWYDAQTEGILQYWKDLEMQSGKIFISEKNQQNPLPKEAIKALSYNRDSILRMVKSGGKKKGNNHGLIIPVGKYQGAVVCLYIQAESSYQQGMIFGIRLLEVSTDGTYKYKINKENRFDELGAMITPDGFTRTEHWLAFRNLKDVPEITQPQKEEVAELMLPEKRKEAVQATMKQVEELYDYVKSHYPKEKSGKADL